MLGEGEGRNGVYAAKLGWEIDAVDWSEKGKEKAERLAAENSEMSRIHDSLYIQKLILTGVSKKLRTIF